MKVEISVPEVVDIFKEIQERPEELFEMIRADIRQSVGDYLSSMMDVELTHFLGRGRYERKAVVRTNHPTGCWGGRGEGTPGPRGRVQDARVATRQTI
jgi:putative transposase